MSASLPVAKEKKQDDIDQAMRRYGKLVSGTPDSLAKEG